MASLWLARVCVFMCAFQRVGIGDGETFSLDVSPYCWEVRTLHFFSNKPSSLTSFQITSHTGQLHGRKRGLYHYVNLFADEISRTGGIDIVSLISSAKRPSVQLIQDGWEMILSGCAKLQRRMGTIFGICLVSGLAGIGLCNQGKSRKRMHFQRIQRRSLANF